MLFNVRQCHKSLSLVLRMDICSLEPIFLWSDVQFISVNSGTQPDGPPTCAVMTYCTFSLAQL